MYCLVMSDTNQQTVNIENLLGGLNKRDIALKGISQEVVDSFLSRIDGLPTNQAFRLMQDLIKETFHCKLRRLKGDTFADQLATLNGCLGCTTNNSAREFVCSSWEVMDEKNTPCLFKGAKNPGDGYVSASVHQTEVPFFYDRNKMETLGTYMRGGQLTLTNFDRCRPPSFLPMIFRQLITPVAQGLKEGSMDSDWLKKENWVVKPRNESKKRSQKVLGRESRMESCAECFQNNCGQCLAGTFRNEGRFLKQLSEANGRSPFRVPDVITEIITGEFYQSDPQLKLLEGQDPNNVLIFGLTLSLSRPWMESIKNNPPVNSK